VTRQASLDSPKFYCSRVGQREKKRRKGETHKGLTGGFNKLTFQRHWQPPLALARLSVTGLTLIGPIPFQRFWILRDCLAGCEAQSLGSILRRPTIRPNINARLDKVTGSPHRIEMSGSDEGSEIETVSNNRQAHQRSISNSAKIPLSSTNLIRMFDRMCGVTKLTFAIGEYRRGSAWCLSTTTLHSVQWRHRSPHTPEPAQTQASDLGND